MAVFHLFFLCLNHVDVANAALMLFSPWTLRLFPFGAVEKNPASSTSVQLSLWVRAFNSFGFARKHGISGRRDNPASNFLRRHLLFSVVAAPSHTVRFAGALCTLRICGREVKRVRYIVHPSLRFSSARAIAGEEGSFKNLSPWWRSCLTSGILCGFFFFFSVPSLYILDSIFHS